MSDRPTQWPSNVTPIEAGKIMQRRHIKGSLKKLPRFTKTVSRGLQILNRRRESWNCKQYHFHTLQPARLPIHCYRVYAASCRSAARREQEKGAKTRNFDAGQRHNNKRVLNILKNEKKKQAHHESEAAAAESKAALRAARQKRERELWSQKKPKK